jgi:hypothetical protein
MRCAPARFRSFKTTHTLFDGFMVLSMFPLSLVLVWVLENIAKLN